MSTFEFWLLRSGTSWTVVPGLTVTWLVVLSENIRKTSVSADMADWEQRHALVLD